MTPTEAAWLAGFIDGEGSLMVAKESHKHCVAPSYVAAIAATNTDRRLIDRCRELAGGKVITVKAKSGKWKDAHIWQLRGVAVGPTIEAILPYLVAKRQQGELLLALRSMTRRGSPIGRNSTRKTDAEVGARASLYEQVRALNRRGNPEYADMAERRIRGDAPLFADVSHSPEDRK